MSDDKIHQQLAVIKEKLDLADNERAELKAWMVLTIENMQAMTELMYQQTQKQIEELKKTRQNTTGQLQSGLQNWRELLPPSWRS